MTGCLKLFIGPMYAGKTTKLIECINEQILCNQTCIVVKHAIDDRYDNTTDKINVHDNIIYKKYIVTHSGYKWDKCDIISSPNIQNILHKLKEFNVVGISEGHFFEDLGLITELCNFGIKVFVEGLNSDYLQNPFKSIIEIIPKCSDIKFYKGVCNYCKTPNSSSYSIRLTDDKNQIVVGGVDLYKAVCMQCLRER